MPSRTTSDDQLDHIVAALHTHGPATAAHLAEAMGIPYSTLTPRLRRLHADSRAERATDPATRQTLWRATSSMDPHQADLSVPTVSFSDATSPGDSIAEPHGPAVDTQSSISEQSFGGDDATGTPDPIPEAPRDVDGSTEHRAARRPKGSIAAAILSVTRAHPDQQFKASQLTKALGGTSAGAIANSASKLVIAGELVLVCEKPATYQAA